MFIICVSCHHHAEITIPKGKQLRCSACGSRVARSVRVIKHVMLNGGVTPSDEARVLTYAGLLSIARERGYKAGWVAHKYRAIYNEWPPDNIPEPANPSPELMWWLRKQNIEYAKTHFPRENQSEKIAMKYKADESLMKDDDWGVDFG